MEEKLKAFLAVCYGSGKGYGSGNGSGNGNGNGKGSGSGKGSGYGDGYGSGKGYGSGNGSGNGYGYGYGYGSGYGDGYGYGDGSGISRFGGHPVAIVDDTQTVFYSIHGNVAKAAILQDDLTLRPCYVAKGGNCFAHGETLRQAQEALKQKLVADMPIGKRIQAFLNAFQPGQTYYNQLFFDWHNRLTGSCEMGRKAFAEKHGIDVENGTMTPEQFISLTENAYGSEIIRQLKAEWEKKAGKAKEKNAYPAPKGDDPPNGVHQGIYVRQCPHPHHG